MDLLEINEMLNVLEASGDYKIIKRFKKTKIYNEPSECKKLIGIFLDVETTGPSAEKDHIIEIALVPFEYTSDGKIYRVLDSYVEFQDPNISIPEFITELTGITNEMVQGKSIDHAKVCELVESASIIVAHHAAFDKKFVEKLFPVFKDKLWGCTVAHVKWRQENISSAKLEYLAYKYGVFYDAHRAEIDSLVGVHILAQILPVSGELVLKVLLENACSKYLKIWALQSPFEMKDILKARGYRWHDGSNNKSKSWYKIVKEDLKDQELEFLYSEIYGRKLPLEIEPVDLFDKI